MLQFSLQAWLLKITRDTEETVVTHLRQLLEWRLKRNI